MAGADQRGLRTAVGLALAVAALLGLAAAGGSLVRGTGSQVDAGDAFPYALIGAGATLVLAAIVVVAVRSAYPDALRLRRWEWLAAAFVAAVIGALLGAALTPETPEADEVSPLEDEEIEQREQQTSSLDEQARAGTVDRDGDGEPDRDADGDVIVGVDSDGDGQLDFYLQPCPPGTSNVESRPGYTPIDHDCDGTVDEWVRFDPNVVLETFDSMPPPDLEPPDTISPQERQQRADDQGADGQRSSTVLWVVLALLGAGLLAAIVVWLVRHRRRRQPPTPDVAAAPETDEPPQATLVAPLTASLDAVLDEPDPRTAICAAYGRLLEALADAGHARRPEEAPEEHARRVLADGGIDSGPVRELLHLFALARFSSHPITEQHRAAAIGAMRAAIASAGRQHDPPPPQQPVAAGWAPPTVAR